LGGWTFSDEGVGGGHGRGGKLTARTLPQNVKNAIDLLNVVDESGINK
jgi:hypothetical protein